MVMKKKEKTSLHSLNSAELVKVIADVKKELAKIRVNRYSKQSKNVHEITFLKRKLAIAETFAHEKELVHE
jgi:ribosomal protein L29